jgi:histone H3/H4
LIREQTETIKAAVPDAVREHLKSIDGQVQEEIQKAAAAQTEKLAEDLVRSAAKDEVQQAVQTLVPSIAEEQIKSEIQRLTKAA